jgi:hypothetical protein
MPVLVSSAEHLLHAELAEVVATLVDDRVHQKICTSSSNSRESGRDLGAGGPAAAKNHVQRAS